MPCRCTGNVPETLSKYDSFVDDFWFVGNSDLGGLPEVAYLGLCLAGESGEIAEKMKKAYRDQCGVVDHLAMAKELGDVLYYLTRYAHLIGFDLDSIARLNVEKLQSRSERGKLRGEGDDR
jgi:NTP pyrophosphatase (non-canonical NTP hydrolase)